MPDTTITPEMRSVVGRPFGNRTSFPVSSSDVRRWATAVYYPAQPPEQFWNENRAGGVRVPEEFNPFAWMSSEGPEEERSGGHDPDRTFTDLGIAGPGLKNQVNGGLTVTYGAPMQTGDVITSTSSIGELTERAGRLGTMLFTTTETVWTNQHGAEVRRQRMTIIRY